MKIEEALNEYKFSNVGQFRGIAQSLGYKESYNKGKLTFTLNEDIFRTSTDEIRAHTQKGTDRVNLDASMSRVCKFFDKDSILSSDYREALRAKEEVDIINWGDIGSDSKDRFTIIDHRNRVCYTGKDFYEYALTNGYVLDGKGTKLEKGVLSDLTSVKGQPAKLRLTNKGVSVFYHKEALVIPDKILGKKLSEKQKKALLEGEVLVFPARKGHVFVSVDRDLNSVIVRSEKELSIPSTMGGRELTAADKYLLANGHSLDNMVLHGDEGYFIADVSWTDDKTGIRFSNMQSISEAKAIELMGRQQQRDSHPAGTEKAPVERQKPRDIEAELREAVEKDDFEKMARLRDEGYKPSEEVIRGLEKSPNMDEKKAVVIDKLFGLKPEASGSGTLAQTGEERKEEVKGMERLAESGIPEMDRSFKTAVENDDFASIDRMKANGYMPSKEIMQSLSGTVPENSLIAVQKIFGLKTNVPSMGDVKLAQSSSHNNTKDISRGVGNIVNKAFADL